MVAALLVALDTGLPAGFVNARNLIELSRSENFLFEGPPIRANPCIALESFEKKKSNIEMVLTDKEVQNIGMWGRKVRVREFQEYHILSIIYFRPGM